MGAYGLVRINMELLPHAHSIFSPWLMLLRSIQIIYAASTSLGIGSISDTGLNRAILQIISHGFIGAALFFLAGTGYDRLRLLYLEQMGGMAIPMPKIFTVFMTKILIIFLNTIGIILTPIYSLSMLRQMFYGYKLFNTPNSYCSNDSIFLSL
ncbi:hypothetical protein Ahy_B03g062597 isoform B [Arachis hypogaea]|uniref:Uncharacterized protein n=1 Tax=Arachis hypogaea TaxID=3818 RepID=A0A444ZUM8_ARAHY|nr:hypothetical protein Ahy_B03g062597 isoform B [Arachis hypogaea]